MGSVAGSGTTAAIKKYHYRRRIAVVRVRCLGCRRTHAVMPAFSLPGTSAGTREAEQYRLVREAGRSRPQASAELMRLGMAASFAKQLERRLAVAVIRAKALWPDGGNERLAGRPGSVPPAGPAPNLC